MNLSVVHRLRLAPFTGRWFRAVPPAYWPRITNTRYTRKLHSRFSPNLQELTGDWAIYNSVQKRPHLASLAAIAPTQELGQRLFDAPGVEGFKVFSAKKPECLCLVVFPEKMLTGSSLTFLNDPKPPKTIVGKREKGAVH